MMLRLHIHLYCNFHYHLDPKGPPGASRSLQGLQGPLETSRDRQGPPGTSKGPPRDLLGNSRDIKGYQGKPRRIFRKLEFLRNLKGLLGAFLMRVRLISVFKLVCLMFIFYWQVTDPNVGFLVNRKNVNIHIEWLQSFILFQSTYQHYDDITKIQTYQMRYYTYSMIHE